MVTAPSADGIIGILPHHIPLFTRLIEGEVKVSRDGEDFYLAIGSGFLEVTDKKVIVLVTAAYKADEINEEEMRQALERAKDALAAGPQGVELVEAQALFRRSTISLSLAGRRRRRSSLPS